MSKWQKFKAVMCTLKAQAYVNAGTSVAWMVMASVHPVEVLRILGAMNVGIFAFLAGSKAADHYSEKRIAMKDAYSDKQHELIMRLLEERAEWLAEMEKMKGEQDDEDDAN